MRRIVRLHGRWPFQPTGPGRLTDEDSEHLSNLSGDDSGAFLKLVDHHCRYEQSQADSADSVVHVFEQSVHTITNAVMAKIKNAMRGMSVKPAPAVAALATRSKAPSHLLPRAKRRQHQQPRRAPRVRLTYLRGRGEARRPCSSVRARMASPLGPRLLGLASTQDKFLTKLACVCRRSPTLRPMCSATASSAASPM